VRRGDTSRAVELRRSLAVLIAVMLGSFGLHLLLDGAAWWFEMAFASAVVLGAAAATRAFTRRRYLPTLVAVVVLLGFVTARFAADTAIFGVFPGGGTIGRIIDLVSGASASIRTQTIPATAGTAILLVLLFGVGIIAIAVDLLATGLRRPALAGIPLLVLAAVPGMTNVDLSDGFAFALAAAGYLWLLLAAREHRNIRLSIISGAIVIIAALVVPCVLPPAEATSGDSGLVSTGIDPTINLGKDLRSSVNTTALVYTTESGHSEYLRLVTLDTFAGEDWAPATPTQRRRNTVDAFPAPVGLSSSVERTTEVTTVTIGNLRSPWLPLPYPTSSVIGLAGGWFWEADSLATSSPDEQIANQSYQVTSLAIQPNPEQLSAAGSVVTGGFDKYLALPRSLPAIISGTAQQVAGGEQGSYAKAVALQQYFRSGDFSYSEKAPVDKGYDGTSLAVLATFLELKSGYCVHFASAMAVMARSLGIPARIAVGFQPGTASGTNSSGSSKYTVTSHDLHAWPELYFDGIGWVPFEPTPGRGKVPGYTDPSVAGVPAPLSPAQQAAQSTASPAPTTRTPGRRDQMKDPSTGASGTVAVVPLWVWLSVALVLLMALALLPALQRMLLREARLRTATAGQAWCEVLATADDLGRPLSATLTPRQIALTLTPAAGGEPLQRLCLAVERESFASGSTHAFDVADVRAVRASLHADASGRRRLVAWLFPPSVWRRILRVFRRGG
jgi:transglutaminase-like putative cysteine protease/uncharacterized membrane protein (UPF0136 family)